MADIETDLESKLKVKLTDGGLSTLYDWCQEMTEAGEDVNKKVIAYKASNLEDKSNYID